MRSLVLVALGGAAGAVARYLVAQAIQAPWATWTVNMLGCVFIGLCAGFALSKQWWTPEIRVFVMVGLLGGFTTFSSFGLESLQLLQSGAFLTAGVNLVSQCLVGLLAVWLGLQWGQVG